MKYGRGDDSLLPTDLDPAVLPPGLEEDERREQEKVRQEPAVDIRSESTDGGDVAPEWDAPVELPPRRKNRREMTHGDIWSRMMNRNIVTTNGGNR